MDFLSESYIGNMNEFLKILGPTVAAGEAVTHRMGGLKEIYMASRVRETGSQTKTAF